MEEYLICNNIVNFYKDMLVHSFLNASLCKNMRRVLCINSTQIYWLWVLLFFSSGKILFVKCSQFSLW